MLGAINAAVSRATTIDWLLLVSGVLLVLYVLGTWRYDFFAKRGVASLRPTLPFMGNTYKAFFTISPLPNVVEQQYFQGKGHSVWGIFEFQKPIFMIRDPELLKVVTVKEFDHFTNHRSFTNEKSDPIFSQNLFSLKDQQWKDMRSTLSPAFTTSKIKAMFPLISECATQMIQHLQEKHATASPKTLEIEMKDLYTRLANDIIATVAFGVGCNSQKDDKNEFYHMGKELTTFTFIRVLVIVALHLSPKLAALFELRVLSKNATDYFDSIVHNTIRERQKKGIFRPDMLQLLMQARAGQLKADADDEHETEKLSNSDHSKLKLSDNDITAQAVAFFFAGFDTVSTGLCFTTYALGRNLDIQERLQREIDEMMKETGGNPTYEAIQEMKYLDAVINESLRLYPPVVVVDRECQEDVVLPPTANSGLILIRKGEIVWVPTFALHHDPEHWPEPEKFDPERFSDENKHKIKPFTYAPFGLGPRVCIGQRFALLEIKLVLVHLLANFTIEPSPKMKEPLQLESGIKVHARGGFWNQLIPRKV